MRRIFFLSLLSAFCTLRWGQGLTQESALSAQYFQALAGESPEPVKCGFPAIAALHAESAYDAKARELLKTAVNRPTLPLSYPTPDGKFRIHYAISGPDAVDPASTNPAGVPDFIYEAGIAAQRAYALLVDTLGMRPHANDNGEDGSEFDFYIQNLGNLYGETKFDFPSGSAGPAYIRLDNDYGPGFYTRGLDGLRVTVAHEYFHAVQLNYLYRSEDVFFFELSSTWFEDAAYDHINDYFAYLRRWFRELATPLNRANGSHEYGSCLWLHYLTKRLGTRAMVRAFWERVVSEQAVYAMRTVLQSTAFNFPFDQAVQEFYTWCYFTGARANPVDYFEEGENYPEIAFDPTNTQEASTGTAFEDDLGALAARYYRFIRTAQDLQLTLQVGVDPGRWTITAISENDDGEYVLTTGAALVPVTVTAQNREDTVTVAVANVGVPANANQFPTADYEVRVVLGEQKDLESVLEKPRPNPYHLAESGGGALLTIPFRIKERTEVKAAIHREDGQVMWQKNFGSLPAGPNEVRWNGLDEKGERVPSGVYFMRLLAGDLIETTKFVVINRAR